MFMFNWGRIAGWTGITITYIVYSVAFYFFVYRLGFRWFWTSKKWSAAIILYPTIDIAVRMLMGVWSHVYCCISDPGIIQRPKRQLKNLKTSGCDDVSDHCKKCDSSRPKRTHHCSTCNACIYQMDHHCPWVNNCVGIGNQKAFILFLAYTSSAAIECLGLAALRLVTCPNVYNSVMVLGLRFIVGESHIAKILSQENFSFDETCDFKIDYAVIGIVAILCAAIFTIFIAFIATDQIQSIVRNQTFVESLKAGCLKAPEAKSPVEIGARLKEVMGSNPSLGWLLPMRSTCWKDSLRSTRSDDGENQNKDASVRGS